MKWVCSAPRIYSLKDRQYCFVHQVTKKGQASSGSFRPDNSEDSIQAIPLRFPLHALAGIACLLFKVTKHPSKSLPAQIVHQRRILPLPPPLPPLQRLLLCSDFSSKEPAGRKNDLFLLFSIPFQQLNYTHFFFCAYVHKLGHRHVQGVPCSPDIWRPSKANVSTPRQRELRISSNVFSSPRRAPREMFQLLYCQFWQRIVFKDFKEAMTTIVGERKQFYFTETTNPKQRLTIEMYLHPFLPGNIHSGSILGSQQTAQHHPGQLQSQAVYSLPTHNFSTAATEFSRNSFQGEENTSPLFQV